MPAHAVRSPLLGSRSGMNDLCIACGRSYIMQIGESTLRHVCAVLVFAGGRSQGVQPHSTSGRALQHPLVRSDPSPSPPATAPRSSRPASQQQPVEDVQTKGLPAGAAAAFAGPLSRGQAQPGESALQSAGLPAKSGAGPLSTPAGQAPPEGGSAKAAGSSAEADEPPLSPRPRYWLRGQTHPGGGRVVTAGVPAPAPAAPAPDPSDITEQPARPVGVIGVPAQAQPAFKSPTTPTEMTGVAAAPTGEDSSMLPTGQHARPA